MSDALLELSDKIERVLDRAQASHLNGFPQEARSQASEAVRLLSALVEEEHRRSVAAPSSLLPKEDR
jgi:hypothetical protein